MILWDNVHVFFTYICFICVSTFIANTYAYVPCMHLLFCASTFCRQYTYFLCMYFMYTCFLYKYFLLSIYTLLMHVCHVHLLFCASIFYRQCTCFLCMYIMYTWFFVQVFFIVNTHASYACISCTLAFLCKYFLSSIHMLLMHVFPVHLLFCASIFLGSLYGQW